MSERNLERELKIKDEWCRFIISCLYDYDGFKNSISGLRSLVDEAIEYASRAIDCDDTTPIFSGRDGKFNILMEKIKERDENNG